MRLLFAAGGTGGHVFPALAIAAAAQKMNAGTEVLFVGTAKGFESRLVPEAGYRLELVDVSGLKGKGFVQRLLGFARLPGAFWQSWAILKRFSPNAVFGIGGYASGPILLLAAFLRTRTAILEPNATPGFSNRVLAKFVDRVFVAFSEAAASFPRKKCFFSGNPIRQAILNVPPPRFEGERRSVLIFGGSQGAQNLNLSVIQALPHFKPLKEKFRFIHQTGERQFNEVCAAYESHGLTAEVHPFIDDMAGAYASADLIVARSGSSVLEIVGCGRPSILVPFPYAADAHQKANAEVLERAGAAIVMSEADLTGEILAQEIVSLAVDRERLQRMSRAALSLRKSDAAGSIARELMGSEA